MKLTVLPSGNVYEFDKITALHTLLPHTVDSPCGGQGRCGKCRVRFASGASVAQPAEEGFFSAQELAAGWRLACVSILTGDAVVDVAFHKVDIAYQKTFGSAFVAVNSGVSGGVGEFGIAIDIGTTTLAAACVSLVSGQVVMAHSALNPQTRFGADVMSRISFAVMQSDGNARLHSMLLDGINDLLRSLGVAPDGIGRVCVVGNPAMLHTFTGDDVRSLGTAPYHGVWTDERELSVGAVGLEALLPDTSVLILPQIKCNIGADTTAAIIAANADEMTGNTLLIDIGTNSEIALCTNGEICVTSTAAGPAFEGAGILHGMRAAQGAIDRVELGQDGELRIHTIGDVAVSRGVCGSGLLDVVACLVRLGNITASGRMLAPGFAPHPALVELDDSGKPQTRLAADVVLTQDDVRQLQLVKGSIRAGIEVLLRHRGITWDDIDRLLIAGSFGAVINMHSAVAIAMFPESVIHKAQSIGNAAGVGAVLALTCPDGTRYRADNIHKDTQYIDCTSIPDYQDIFADAMSFESSEEF